MVLMGLSVGETIVDSLGREWRVEGFVHVEGHHIINQLDEIQYGDIAVHGMWRLPFVEVSLRLMSLGSAKKAAESGIEDYRRFRELGGGTEPPVPDDAPEGKK